MLRRLALAAALMLAAVPAAAEQIDRIAASVNNDIVTRSELQQSALFNSILSSGTGSVSRKLETETLEGLINRKLLLQEAYRLRYVEVTDADVAAEVGRLRKRLGTEQAFRDLLVRAGLTPAELDRMLAERLLVERFVEKKIGLFARVNRDEAEQYYREHERDFTGRKESEVLPQITAMLTAQKTMQQLDQYIAELRGRADIRINPLEEPQEAAGNK